MMHGDISEDRLKLDRVAFYGRTLEEYLLVFGLDADKLTGQKVLDCPSGASSFTAQARHAGVKAFACDPMLAIDLDELISQGQADIEHVTDRVKPVSHLFEWSFYDSIEGLKRYREQALHLFADDYRQAREYRRYIGASLPELPFGDDCFDLVLSGHFLFTYSDRYDYDFHLAAIMEMSRVSAGEVRIYPLQGPDARSYRHMDVLIDDIKTKELDVRIVPTSFNFQKGSNQMLVIGTAND